MKPGDSKSIEHLFDEVAFKYDLLNDLLSFGLHRVWKRKLIASLKPLPGESWLDICCGTGDLALALANHVAPSGQVMAIDFAQQPLRVAKQRSCKRSINSIQWLQRDALCTGLSSSLFNGVVMAYGLRNLSDPKLGLKELKRVLKPGGRAGILDFHRTADNSLPTIFQKFYLRSVVVPTASFVGLRDHYTYLEKSLKIFPTGTLQEDIALEVGFSEANHQTLAFGQMGLLILKK